MGQSWRSKVHCRAPTDTGIVGSIPAWCVLSALWQVEKQDLSPQPYTASRSRVWAGPYAEAKRQEREAEFTSI
jgi:hypothetical protein